MGDDPIQRLIERGVMLLRLPRSQWNEIESKRHGGGRFSLHFPHDNARAGRVRSVAIIVVSGDEGRLLIGCVRSVATDATLDSRVVFDLVRPIAPNDFAPLLSEITDSTLAAGRAKLASGTQGYQAVSERLGEALLQKIWTHEVNRPALLRIVAEIDRPRRFENARALQQDAIALALKAFGANELQSVALKGETELRRYEDNVIEHDARWIPGWKLVDSDVTGRAVFTRRDQQLEVITANKRPLEVLFGVDLIYLNQQRGSLILVQYKMMEKDGGGKGASDTSDSDGGDDEESVESDTDELDTRRAGGASGDDVGEEEEQDWLVRIDPQFTDELARMRTFNRDLAQDGAYRLNSGAFFLKLVRRYAGTNSAGIILSLAHFDHLLGENALTGPRGGLRISYKKLDGHYLRSDAFVELVRSGYIGTRGATTDHMQSLIKPTLEGNRAVVAAIQSAIPASPKKA